MFGGKWQKQLDGVRSSPFSTKALVLRACSMGPLSHPPLGYSVLAAWPAKLRCVVKVKYTTALKDSVRKRIQKISVICVLVTCGRDNIYYLLGLIKSINKINLTHFFLFYLWLLRSLTLHM